MDHDAKFRTAAELLIARLGEDAPGAAAECAVASLRQGDDAAALGWIEIVKLALVATGASPLVLRRSLAETLRRAAAGGAPPAIRGTRLQLAVLGDWTGAIDAAGSEEFPS
jgi:hypothetical protein